MPAAKKSEPDEKGGGLKVSAPMVGIRVGSRVLNFYKGDVLPDGVNSDDLEHLKSLGFVESV